MIHVNVRGIIECFATGEKQILIQTRSRTGEPSQYELPGGRVEEFESLTEALAREVLEETGLKVTSIEGEASQITTDSMASTFFIQCIKPFAAYQTTKGPVDSMGVYFICEAKGELVENGDDTKAPHFVGLEELNRIVSTEGTFTDIDRPAVLMYLREQNVTEK